MEREADVLQQRVEPHALRPAAGSSRSNGFEDEQQEGVEAQPDEGLRGRASPASSARAGAARRSAISPPASAITVTHSSIEPSWLPQAPASLKISGLAECEFVGDQRDRQVGAREQQQQRAEGERAQQRLDHRRRPHQRGEPRPALRAARATPASSCSPASAAASHSAARPSSAIIRRFRHRLRASARRSCPRARAACSSRRAWRAGCRRRTCRRRRSAPSATTPEPSTNRSGTMPRERTGTRALPSPTTKSIVTPSARVLSEPCSTMPPSRTAWPGAGGSAAMSLGT